MKHGFIKVAAVSCAVTPADCEKNATEIIKSVKEASDLGVKLTVFPELCLSSAFCGDLFFSDALLNGAKKALLRITEETSDLDTIIIIGFPLLVNDKIYNCAAFCQKGRIFGVIPKSVISNSYSEFTSPCASTVKAIDIGGKSVPFGKAIVFTCSNLPSLKIGVEIGNEAFAQISPSVSLCSAGATIIANPSATLETVGAEEYKTTMLSSLSARNVCGYIHSGAGEGESTTNGACGGYCAILENGKLLADRKAFTAGQTLTVTEIDLGLISCERRRNILNDADHDLTEIFFELELCETELTRVIPQSPFVPDSPIETAKRCNTILTIQAKALATRMTRAYAKTLVIGISGGLDSCLAVLVAAKALDMLNRPRTDIIGVTMPCFGTTSRTKSNAELLCAELGATFRCVDIGEAVNRHFYDIGHDPSNHNVVYENSQARERTQVIMDIANMENGLVVGTGDLSELVLGWATYNGDHMSMYGVNGSVPKTLIRHIVKFCADKAKQDGRNTLSSVLYDILGTPVSPELLPADADGNIAQKTEDLVGPYEIHDFYIYYMLRYGFAPDKLYRLARYSLGNKYADEELLKWLRNLIRRFFAQQFKRSCLPDGPKIGTVGVSPRGELSMPSDASCAQWLKIVESL